MRSVQLGRILLFLVVTASAENAFGQGPVAAFCAVNVDRTCLEHMGSRANYNIGDCPSLGCSGILHECGGYGIPYSHSTFVTNKTADQWFSELGPRTEPVGPNGTGNWTTSNILNLAKICAFGLVCNPYCVFDIDAGNYICTMQRTDPLGFGTYPLGEVCDGPQE